MGNVLHIGNAPRLNTHGGIGLMSSEKALLKVNVYPRVLAKNGLDQILNSITGVVQMEDGSADLKQRASAIAGKFPVAPFDSIVLHCQQSGAITDTYTNSIEQAAILGKLNNTLGNNEFSTMMKQWKQSGISPAEVVRQSVGTLAGIAKKTNLISADTAKGVDKGINDVINNTNRYIDLAKNKGSMEKFFMSDLGMDDSSAKIAAALTSQSVAILSGDTPVIPNLWANSSASSVYSFIVRLYNPVPASLDMHHTYIMQPLAYLKALALPASEMGSTKVNEGTENEDTRATGNDRTYSNPLYVEAEASGLFSCKAGIISNLSIIKGGDENAIAFNGRPIYVDVNLTIQPLYNVTIISAINPDTSSVNAATDYAVMHGEDGDGRDPLAGNADAAQTGPNDLVTSVAEAGKRISETQKSRYQEAAEISEKPVSSGVDKTLNFGDPVIIPPEKEEQMSWTTLDSVTSGKVETPQPDGSVEIYTVEKDKSGFVETTTKEIVKDGQVLTKETSVIATTNVDDLKFKSNLDNSPVGEYRNMYEEAQSLLDSSVMTFDANEKLSEIQNQIDAAQAEVQAALDAGTEAAAASAVASVMTADMNMNIGEKGLTGSDKSSVKGKYFSLKDKINKIQKDVTEKVSKISGGKFNSYDEGVKAVLTTPEAKIEVKSNGQDTEISCGIERPSHVSPGHMPM